MNYGNCQYLTPMQHYAEKSKIKKTYFSCRKSNFRQKITKDTFVFAPTTKIEL